MRRSFFRVILIACFAVLTVTTLQAQPALLGLRALQLETRQQDPSEIQSDGSVPSRTSNPAHFEPPATLVLPAGTIITVEASEMISSDKQHDGDNFVAELQNPLVVDGWVVARPGQTVMGRVAGAKRAGRVKGTSKLSLEIQQIVLVDGRQALVQSEMVENSGPTSQGRDLAAVAITTGIGAAIGAVCGAKGAAIGAALGATASIAGVLLTRGEETEVTPENLLTFRLASPLTVSTGESQHAFWQVTADDYIVPEKIGSRPQGAPRPVVISQPGPRRVPVSVWPESQGLVIGRPGLRRCGS